MSPRVLHIIDNFDRCSVEAWLLQMMRHARLRGIELDWTFYCAIGQPGGREADALALGAKIVHSPVPLGSERAFIRALRKELRRGKYEVLHAHHDLVSAVYLV